MKLRDHAGDSLLTERYQRPPAYHGRHSCRNAVGEHGVERAGYGNVAEFMHGTDRKCVPAAGNFRLLPERPSFNHANSEGVFTRRDRNFTNPLPSADNLLSHPSYHSAIHKCMLG